MSFHPGGGRGEALIECSEVSEPVLSRDGSRRRGRGSVAAPLLGGLTVLTQASPLGSGREEKGPTISLRDWDASRHDIMQCGSGWGERGVNGRLETLLQSGVRLLYPSSRAFDAFLQHQLRHEIATVAQGG
ncbi:hypothetical protein EYF80_020622 [Liparis tanakae]|uniref:Uncharacterized protein n=1 Tax=Liparis tanakae TaxID=230148 RepID=A0A4Z2HV31_9TELE|nr:hypothetical protein EYF80_020622 [Liparis tanakae]